VATDFKQGRSTLQAMTVTALASMASSTTAGWQSAVVDNTTNLYADAQVMVVLDFANTAPANEKTAYVYAAGGIESGVLTNPASGSQGSITLLDITTTAQALKLIGTVPYTTQDEAVEAGPFSVGLAFGGMLPDFWSIVIMNYSGAALAASGHTVKWRGIYGTGS
jgi:hypothetical protein